MKRAHRIGLVASLGILMLLGSTVVWVHAQATTQPTDSAKPAHVRGLVSPYSKLTGLSEEQKKKLIDIHMKAVAEKKAIEDKEEADSMAVLTDEQKAQIEKMKADQRAQQKARAADRKASKGKDADKGDKKDDEDEKEKDK